MNLCFGKKNEVVKFVLVKLVVGLQLNCYWLLSLHPTIVHVYTIYIVTILNSYMSLRNPYQPLLVVKPALYHSTCIYHLTLVPY